MGGRGGQLKLDKSLTQSNRDNATWREETCAKRSNIVIVKLTLVCSADHLLDDGRAVADVASFLQHLVQGMGVQVDSVVQIGGVDGHLRTTRPRREAKQPRA